MPDQRPKRGQGGHQDAPQAINPPLKEIRFLNTPLGLGDKDPDTGIIDLVAIVAPTEVHVHPLGPELIEELIKRHTGGIEIAKGPLPPAEQK